MMARDINELVEQSLGRKTIKGCPFPQLTGEAAKYLEALNQHSYEELNKQRIQKIFVEVFKVDIPSKRVYDHFNPDNSCGC